MKYFLKKLVDLVYMSPIKLNKFRKKYPKDKIIAYGGSKGIKLDSEEDVKRGVNWLTSKRSLFILSNQRIIAGNWEIDIESIKEAQLLCYGTGMVLKMETTKGEFYQFGLQYIKELLNQDKLEIKLTDSKVKYSLFSIILRAIAIIILIKEFVLPKL